MKAAAGATWTVLGAGSILPRTGYGCAGYALRPGPGAPVTLFDCGPGTVRALAPAGIRLEEVRRVVLTHFHTDHCLDLFALFFARRNPRFADGPELEIPELEIIGPRGVQALVRGGPEVLGRWTEDPRAVVREVHLDRNGRDGRVELELDDLRLSAVPTRHTPEALAWRATLPDGSSVTFTGDTGENPDVADLARATDLFVVECSFPDAMAVEHHLTPASAARMAASSGCKALLLTHFYPEMEPTEARATAAATYLGPILLARDGLAMTIAPAREL